MDNRRALLKVSRFGDKTFEQAAGFLRVMNGSNPLDASAVHPESYPVVERIAKREQRDISSLVGDGPFLRSLKPAEFIDDNVGLPTVVDIISELDKPGRDPRPEFKVAALADGVEKMSDLEPDMIMEGTVTNVTNFGAFVDVGVHQDGLVHISALSEKFIKDPRDIVKAGDIVKVKVMEVDQPRKRIALSMRLSDKAGDKEDRPKGKERNKTRTPRQQHSQKEAPATNGAFAAAFANAKKVR